MPIVTMPDGTNVQFPDEMPKEQIRDLIATKFPDAVPQAKPEASPGDIGGGWSAADEANKIEAMRQPGAFSDATDSILTGIPFGDEITAGLQAPVRAAISAFKGDGFDVGKEYTRAVETERELQRRRADRSPIASTVGGVAGGMATAAPMAKAGFSLLQGAKPTLGSLGGRGAAEGAGYGLIYGAGEGEGGLLNRAESAAKGAVIGGTIGGVTGGLARIGAGGGVADDAIPSVEQLKQASQAAFKAADDLGVSFAPGYSKQLGHELAHDLRKAGIDQTIHPKATAAFKRIAESVGQPLPLSEVQTLRRVAQSAASSVEPDERRIAQIMIDRLDKFVDKAKPQQVLSGKPEEAGRVLRQARDYWSRMRKTELVQDALYGAEIRTAATGSGGNIDNASRQRLASLLLDKNKSRGFTRAEREALERVIRGTKGQNALRLAGKLSPQGNGLMAALGVGGAMVNPAFGAASLGGMGAKAIADRMTGSNAKLLEQVIRNGGANLPKAQLTALRKAIADVAAVEGGQSVPRYIDQ